jgi:hypothetical protein
MAASSGGFSGAHMFEFTRTMIARLLMLGAVCLVTSGSQVSCSSGTSAQVPGGGTGNGPTFTTTLVLRDAAGAETNSFSRGDLIRFELTVRNRTDQTVHLTLNSGLQSDFVVFDNGGNVPRWQWSEGKVFITGTTEITFAPLETRVFTVDWNQQLRTGDALAAGSYEARGVLPFEAFASNPQAPHELGSTLRAFRVN